MWSWRGEGDKPSDKRNLFHFIESLRIQNIASPLTRTFLHSWWKLKKLQVGRATIELIKIGRKKKRNFILFARVFTANNTESRRKFREKNLQWEKSTFCRKSRHRSTEKIPLRTLRDHAKHRSEKSIFEKKSFQRGSRLRFLFSVNRRAFISRTSLRDTLEPATCGNAAGLSPAWGW